jgi:Tfp pilus assembly protein PilE
LIEKFSYSGKIKEAESVCNNIEKKQGELYATKNEYVAVTKSNQSLLMSTLEVRKIDLKYYNYTVTTTNKSFTIVAEPKIKFIKNREVPLKVYTLTHIVNGAVTKTWSKL